IMLDLEEGEEEDINEYKENNMPETKTMWDDIQIEVTAEFKKVKMSLGDLKQISKGLVIDLGAVMNNEISLLVENKTVAKGELVIINDKYGVKINQVLATQNPANQIEENTPEQKAQAQNHPQAQTPQQKSPVQPPPQPVQGAAHPMPPSKPPQRPIPQGAKPALPPQGARPAPKPMPQKAPAKPAPKSAQQGAKENFDYSNFEE
ncbi:MAG: FliM/FliN family flagellar motor switch protein, partial [Candidatus Gastranaerophilales bacterium]|nr:FliM/FliN family flagellar motor switch protein [Candidatus Gastranaerophilales bacterium]